MLSCFSCAVFVMLALLLSCVDGCFLSIFVMSKLVLLCYANSRLRFVLACFPCLMLVLAFFPFADARLFVLLILACISCVDSFLVFPMLAFYSCSSYACLFSLSGAGAC